MKRRPQQYRSPGFTIIELMIALFVTMVISLITANFAVNVFRSNTESVLMIQLSQEMRSAIQLVSRDIRRAGYEDDALARYLATQAVDSGVVLGPIDANGDAECVQLAYEDLGGKSVSAVYRRRVIAEVGRVAANFEAGASCATSLDAAGWVDITDPLLTHIQSLEFRHYDSLTDISENSSTGNVIQVGVESIYISIAAELTSNNSIVRTITNRVQLRNQYLKV